MQRSRFAEENSSNYCISLLAEESEKALSAVYSSIDSVLLILLVLLHSKIVYTLWFKHSNNVLTPHQQVCGKTQLGLAPESGILNNALYGEAPPWCPTPYHFIYYFWQKRYPFRAEPPSIGYYRKYPPGFSWSLTGVYSLPYILKL